MTKTYLQVDKLQDYQTANLVIDEIIRFSQVTLRNPTNEAINLAYEFTVHGNPLRKLMRDYTVHETLSTEYLDFHSSELHPDLLRDVAVEFLRAKDYNHFEYVEDVYHYGVAKVVETDRHYYHQDMMF